MNVNLQTGMQEGTYCDIISGAREGESCSGKSVYVDNSGMVSLSIGSWEEDPMIAIHVGKEQQCLKMLKMISNDPDLNIPGEVLNNSPNFA